MREVFYFLVIALFVCYLISYDNHEKQYGKIRYNFLKEIIVNGEKRTIVDYDFFQVSYIMDNGVKIDREATRRLLGDEYGK